MEVETAQRLESRRLLVYGTVLFFIGLVNGLLIPAAPDTRRALSAHLVGVQDGMVLWAFGLMWDRVNLRPRVRRLVIASAIYSMYAIWIGLALAIGIHPRSPGEGAPMLQALIAVSEASGSVAILGASVGVITGLVTQRRVLPAAPRSVLAAGEKT